MPLLAEMDWALPEDSVGFGGYSQHNYDTLPLPSEHVTAANILRFRDMAFMRYFDRPEYLSMLQAKFGDGAVEDVKAMLAFGMPKRRLLNAV